MSKEKIVQNRITIRNTRKVCTLVRLNQISTKSQLQYKIRFSITWFSSFTPSKKREKKRAPVTPLENNSESFACSASRGLGRVGEESLRDESNKEYTTSSIAEKTETPKPAITDIELSYNGTCSQETEMRNPRRFCLACDATAWSHGDQALLLQLVCKKCQRSWTAGGTMRSVLVGAWRRKNKNLASHNNCVSITSVKAIICRRRLQKSLIFNIIMATPHFGSDPVLCESMASRLNLS
ncbi:hypothetical protein Bca4012_064648 [Brassica carinata]